jgi:excisionase family DNA binding protein
MAADALPEYHGRDHSGSDIAVRHGQSVNPGGPTVPPLPSPSLSGPLLRYLVRHLVRDARDGGGLAHPDLAAYLRALAEADGTVADDGHDDDDSGSLDLPVMATVAQLAERSGYSCRTLRRWAASGRLTARQVGRVWLIDPDSLTEGRT